TALGCPQALRYSCYAHLGPGSPRPRSVTSMKRIRNPKALLRRRYIANQLLEGPSVWLVGADPSFHRGRTPGRSAIVCGVLRRFHEQILAPLHAYDTNRNLAARRGA